jgi:hypothetical protein
LGVTEISRADAMIHTCQVLPSNGEIQSIMILVERQIYHEQMSLAVHEFKHRERYSQ